LITYNARGYNAGNSLSLGRSERRLGRSDKMGVRSWGGEKRSRERNWRRDGRRWERVRRGNESEG
jgi:hypothetical protein